MVRERRRWAILEEIVATRRSDGLRSNQVEKEREGGRRYRQESKGITEQFDFHFPRSSLLMPALPSEHSYGRGNHYMGGKYTPAFPSIINLRAFKLNEEKN